METLKIGSTGTLVEYLQSTLKTLGFNTGKIDGIFRESNQKRCTCFSKKLWHHTRWNCW